MQTDFGWIIISIENTWSIEGEFFPICVLYKNRKQKQVLQRRVCMKQDKKEKRNNQEIEQTAGNTQAIQEEQKKDEENEKKTV